MAWRMALVYYTHVERDLTSSRPGSKTIAPTSQDPADRLKVVA